MTDVFSSDPLIYSVSPPNSNITDIVVDKTVQITLEQYEGVKKHFISSISDFSVGDISTYHASKFEAYFNNTFNSQYLTSL